MINIQAKNRILNLYKEGSSSYEKVKREEYRQLFYAIRPYMTSTNKEWNMAVGEFLCKGAMAFNRFIGLRPNYINDDMYHMFCEFLSTLQSLDGKYQGRTFFFYLEKYKSLKPILKNIFSDLRKNNPQHFAEHFYHPQIH